MNELFDIAKRAVDEYGAMQKPSELAALLAVIREIEPLDIWEIGTATGGTLWAVASALDRGRTYVSIDLPGGPHGGNECVADDELRGLLESVANDFTIIRGDSLTVPLPTHPPDLVLIDGDHSAEGVRKDWQRYSPRVITGGLVALHDIVPHPPLAGVEVAPMWATLTETYANTVEIVDRKPNSQGQQWGGWGLVFL